MRVIRTSLLFVLLLGTSIEVLSQFRSESVRLTHKDKSQILSGVIEDSLDKLMGDPAFDQCAIPVVKGKKILLINTDLPMKSPFDVGEFRFRAMSRKEIEREIKDNSGDCYFDTSPLRIDSAGKVEITIWRQIEVITYYPSRWAHGIGRVYEASRAGATWRVKFLHSTALFT